MRNFIHCGGVFQQNVRALRLAVAVMALKFSEKTPRLPLVGSRALVRLVECDGGWEA
jgi:hypothetical protein